METENKNLDSTNDSVESFEEAKDHLDTFEDAIDHLESTEDKNLSKTEDKNQPILTPDSNDASVTSQNKESDKTSPGVKDVVKDSSPPDVKETTDVKASEVVITATSNEKIELKDEIKTSSEMSDLSSSEAVKTASDNLDKITTNLADIAINETKIEQELVSNVKLDSKVEVEKTTNGSTVELNVSKEPLKEESHIVKEDIPKEVKEMLPKEDAKETLPKEAAKETIPKESVKETIPKETPKEVISTEVSPKETEKEEPVKESPKEATKVEDSKILPEHDQSVSEDTNNADIKVDDKNDNVNSKTEEDLDNNAHESDEGSIKSERECGDGQGEQEDAKKELDHDEDKRNPEYIPKKGSFYEHDTRTMDGFDDDVKKIEEETASKSKKKPKPVSSEGRWEHDKFNELEQCPKSQQEIIDTRGPNKYNRNWEDEKAYIKIENKPRTPGSRHPRTNNDRVRHSQGSENDHQPNKEREEFPPLSRSENHADKRTHRPGGGVDNVAPVVDKPAPLHYSDKIGMKAEKGAWVPPPPFSQKNVVNKNHSGSENENTKPHTSHPTAPAAKDQPLSTDKPSPPKPKAFTPLNNANFTPTATANPRGGNFRSPSANNFLSHRNDIFPNGTKVQKSKLPESGLVRPRPNWEPGNNNWFINQNKIESTGPPETPDLPHKDYSKLSGAGAVAALRGGKRYSVQRQQSLPESARNPAAVAPSVPPGEIESVAPNENSTTQPGQGGQTLTAYYHHQATGTAPPITVPHHTISNGAGGAPPMLLPVHFVSPPPSQVPAFNNNQTPIMSYGPHQPMQFQTMQPIVTLPPPPQTEVFQPAGGITYYSPQTQAVLQRPTLSKRVKSAIPIVPPNEANNVNNLMQQNNLIQQQQNNLIQQSNLMQQQSGVLQQSNLIQQQPVQLVPVEINKDEGLSN
ncbi:hypothetical protein M8J75_013504 [Diaphorina citri]|nr:hypothetical protein M8J75_013504 [Diaphorina citri]